MSYARFGAMIATSTLVMFGLMYLNTYALDHVFFSQTRAWMALVMGATMAVIMLGVHAGACIRPRREHRHRRGQRRWSSRARSGWCAARRRSRTSSYMKAMIPHHSIAIMTSERAHIRDPRVRELADGIIEAQVREIAEMKQLLAALEREPVPAGAPDLAPAKPGSR